MTHEIRHPLLRPLPVACVLLTLTMLAGCGEMTPTQPGSSPNGVPAAKSTESAALPLRGKVVSPTAPARAVIGMVWYNSFSGAEFIFDGAEWVPHDASADEFYLAKDKAAKGSAKSVAMTQDEVCVDGDPACTPSGAHQKPEGFDCLVCHKVAGRVAFDSTGPAYRAGGPAPTFDAVTKTCQNVACHGVPAGTFSYYFVDGTGEAEYKTVNYGGTTLSTATPSWYATGAVTCTACHGDPPRLGSDGTNVWHSGYHGGQGPTGPMNQCQFCHPDAYSPNNGIGTTITDPSRHANGTVNVQARFKSTCFGCH